MDTVRHQRFWRVAIAGVVGVGLVGVPTLAGGFGGGSGKAVAMMPAQGLYGVVVDQDGVPLSGVRVDLFGVVAADSDQDPEYSPQGVEVDFVDWQVVGYTGEFNWDHLQCDQLYVIQFSGPGLATEYVPGTTDLNLARQFDCMDADNWMYLNVGELVAQPGAELSGQVVDSDGLPVEGLSVQVWLVSDEADEDTQPAVMVTTDAAGGFETPSLREGTYRVSWAGDSGFVGSDLSGSGVSVEVSVDQDNELDEPLVVVRGGSLLGSVVDPDGAPVADVAVMVLREVYDEWSSADVAVADEVGGFVFDGLLPGSYRVETQRTDVFLPAQALDSFGQPASFDVTEAGSAVVGSVGLEPGAVVTGTVAAVDDDIGVAGLGVSVYVEQTDEESGQALWEALTGGEVEEDGTFMVSGLPTGPVLVLVNGGGELVSRYNGGAEFEETASPVELTPPDTVDVGTIELPTAAVVEGEVLGEDGVLAAGVPVFVLAPNADGQFEAVDGGQTDEFGHYQIGGLPGGDYQVTAVSPELDEAGEQQASEPVEVEVETAETVEAPELQLEPASSLEDINAPASGSPQTYAATGAAPVIAAQWPIATHNVGNFYYDPNASASPPNEVCQNSDRTKSSSCWSARVGSLAAELKTPIKMTVNGTWAPVIVALQESTNGSVSSQTATLLAKLGSDYAVAVPQDRLNLLLPEAVPGRVVGSMSRNNQLIYRKSDVSVVTYGANSGRQYLKDVGGATALDYATALSVPIVPNPKWKELPVPKPDKVFPWAIFRKNAASNQGGRQRLIIVSSVHLPTSDHLHMDIAGYNIDKHEVRYYKSNMVLKVAEQLDWLSCLGTQNGVAYSACMPYVVAGDLNGYYLQSTRVIKNKGTIVKSAPKMLWDKGLIDLRGYHQTSDSCTGTCATNITTKWSPKVFDYIFVGFRPAFINLVTAKFITASGNKWYSDHKMIAGEIIVFDKVAS